jgi:hypothetical protein
MQIASYNLHTFAASVKSATVTEVDKQQISPAMTLSEEEIQKRKEYLCRQRDKLLQARGKSKTSTDEGGKDAIEIDDSYEQENVIEKEPEQAIQMRRALVNRLKSEIINKK